MLSLLVIVLPILVAIIAVAIVLPIVLSSKKDETREVNDAEEKKEE